MSRRSEGGDGGDGKRSRDSAWEKLQAAQHGLDRGAPGVGGGGTASGGGRIDRPGSHTPGLSHPGELALGPEKKKEELRPNLPDRTGSGSARARLEDGTTLQDRSRPADGNTSQGTQTTEATKPEADQPRLPDKRRDEGVAPEREKDKAPTS